MPKRLAQVVAAVVEVLCPYCAEPQPNPDNGSHLWSPEEVRSELRAGKTARECVSCERPFTLHLPSRLAV